VTRLAEAHQAGRLADELRRLGRYPLLVIDEVGYIPFEHEAANLFFQLVSSRYERASLIVTSNKPFGRWGEVFGDKVVAAAMIDRLVHHAEVISRKGDSYRLKDRDLGRMRLSRVERPRVRAVDGSGELSVPAYELFSSTEILGRMAMDRMLAGLSTRRYQVGLEPVGQQVSEVATSTSRSAVSRKVRDTDRDRSGWAAQRRPEHSGPGRVDDRRGALRRVVLRCGARHRHQR